MHPQLSQKSRMAQLRVFICDKVFLQDHHDLGTSECEIGLMGCNYGRKQIMFGKKTQWEGTMPWLKVLQTFLRRVIYSRCGSDFWAPMGFIEYSIEFLTKTNYLSFRGFILPWLHH